MAVRIEEQVIVDLTVEMKNLTAGLRQAQKATKTSTKAMEKDFVSLGKVGVAAYALIASAAIHAATAQIKALVRVADGWNLVEGRIKLVSASSEDLAKNQEALFDIAQESRVEYETVADLYARIARNTKQMNIEDAERLEVTEAIAKSLIISGASAESANAALVQFGQGLAAGALRGQELNSVMEQTPRLSEAIATGMGLTIGQLRKVAEQGKLTAEAVMNAISGQLEQINKEFAEMPVTIGQASVVMSDVFQKFVGELDDALGISNQLTDSMIGLANDVKTDMDDIIHTFSFWIAAISRTIDGYKLLFATISLGVTTIVAAFQAGYRNIGNAADLRINQMKAAFYEVQVAALDAGKAFGDAFGATESDSDLKTRMDAVYDLYVAQANAAKAQDRLNNDKGVLGDEDVVAQAKVVNDLAKAYNLTIEERLELYQAESAEHAAKNKFRREQEAFIKQAIADQKELDRMLKSSIRLDTQKLGERSSGGLSTAQTDASIAAAEELMRVIEKAREAGRINAAEYERYVYNVGKAIEKTYTQGARDVTVYNNEVEKSITDMIALEKSIISLERAKAKDGGYSAESDIKENLETIYNLYKALWDARLISETEYQKAITDTHKLAVKESTELAQIREALGSQLENAFMSSIRNMMDGTQEWGDMFKSLLKDIIAEMIRIVFIKEAAASISTGITGLFSAQGNVFEQGAHVTAYAQGGVVSSPTAFPMVGGVGIMGEAGPEAIMPLTRTSGGDLGVKAEVPPMQVTIINNGNDEVTTQQDKDGMLMVIIDKVSASIATGISRGTSPVGDAIQSSYGVSR